MINKSNFDRWPCHKNFFKAKFKRSNSALGKKNFFKSFLNKKSNGYERIYSSFNSWNKKYTLDLFFVGKDIFNL